jgi:hypothetical protein
MEDKINRILEDIVQAFAITFMFLLHMLPFAVAIYVAVHFITKYW